METFETVEVGQKRRWAFRRDEEEKDITFTVTGFKSSQGRDWSLLHYDSGRRESFETRFVQSGSLVVGQKENNCE